MRFLAHKHLDLIHKNNSDLIKFDPVSYQIKIIKKIPINSLFLMLFVYFILLSYFYICAEKKR